MSEKRPSPRVLFLDIETAPILGYVWSLWQQNVGLNQIKQDWFILSWSAKWLGSKKVMYKDQRNAKYIENDKRLLEPLWKLLDAADIIVTQNGKQFDAKKINARLILNGMKPPSSYRHIDTKILAKRHFAFTSNRLEYMADQLCTKYKKLKHHKFQGFELWRECLAGNLEAWREMEKYNKHDVLALEELYEKLSPWDTSISFNVYHDREDFVCQCGHPAFARWGFKYTNGAKYQRLKCKRCGAEYREKMNLLTKPKRASLKAGGT
jgi:uncharacterized protein YprB with RNaseH-like and TPR domain